MSSTFVVGLALGTIVRGFCAIGSFNRGFDSVRRKAWSRELDARKRASVKARDVARVVVAPMRAGVMRKAS